MCSLEVGFIKVDSSNLPEGNIFIKMDYFNKNNDFVSTEMRGIKLQR